MDASSFIDIFLQASLLALGLILPLGPQNIFLLSQGASHKQFKQVLPAIITAGLCDTILILLAILGVSAVVLAFPVIKGIFVVFGVCFLLLIAYKTFNTPVSINNTDGAATPWKRQVLYTLSVSLLNPHAILDSIGVIGTASLSYHGHARTVFAIGCISVSWLWFIGIVLTGRGITHIDRSGLIQKHLNHVAAFIIVASAAYLVYLNLF